MEIPWEDVKGIKTQLKEGKSHAAIGEYFGVSQDTISRRVKEKIRSGEYNPDSEDARKDNPVEFVEGSLMPDQERLEAKLDLLNEILEIEN